MDNKHTKPTKEDLKKGINKVIDDLENPSPSKPAPSPSPSHSNESPSPSESQPSASPSPSQTHGSPSASPSPSPEDEEEKLRKKASASAREAQILHARNKKYDEAVDEADNITEPSDEDMVKEMGKDEWDSLPNSMRSLAKRNWVNEKRFELISRASKEGKEVQAWLKKVDDFVSDPKTLNKYPELEGKQEDFKLFVIKPTRRGLDWEDLLLAFNGELSKNPPSKKKGQMFERGSAGRKEKKSPNDGKLSLEDAGKLMKNDYKKYKELLKAGKIRSI